MSSRNEEESTFGADVVAFTLSTILAVWGVYTTFIVMGAMMATLFERGDLRFAGAMILALIIPILTAMGANSRKEGAEGIQRLTRVAIGTTIFSAGCAAIVCLALASMVVPSMESDPNWFLENPDSTQGTPALNRRYSNIIAGMSCRLAHSAGTYYCPPEVGR